MSLHPVIYLTGAPATGKSTLSRNLAARFTDLQVFTYSEELRQLLARGSSTAALTEDEIRRHSANVVTAAHVTQLDRELIDKVRAERQRGPFLIDSHPVTKEAYGFRVTAFSAELVRSLDPDVIICLYAPSQVIRDRIAKSAMGRPHVTEFEADMHSQLQASVAAQYGVLTGKPVYYLDSSVSEAELVDLAAAKSKLAT